MGGKGQKNMRYRRKEGKVGNPRFASWEEHQERPSCEKEVKREKS